MGLPSKRLKKSLLIQLFSSWERGPVSGTKICPLLEERRSHYQSKNVESRFFICSSLPSVWKSATRKWKVSGGGGNKDILASGWERFFQVLFHSNQQILCLSLAFPLSQLRLGTDCCVVRTQSEMLQDRLHSKSLDLLLIIGSGKKLLSYRHVFQWKSRATKW